jgi:hypothetical protein
MSSVPSLLPTYKSFTHVPGLPESLLTLCGNSLLHLHTNYSDADSVLGVKEGTSETYDYSYIAVPPPPSRGSMWLTVLDVDPKAQVFALLSDSGVLLFLRLRMRLQLGSRNGTYISESQNQVSLSHKFTGGTSVCLEDKRFFVLQTASGQVQVFHCDLADYTLTVLKAVKHVLDLINLDYNTENNVLHSYEDVLYHQEEAIATVPVDCRLLSVFGTQCMCFQLLVWKDGGVEWWRWTGTDCEATRLPPLLGVPQGNLLWF